ncbi:Serine/threonine-protein kinase Sgk1 [Smittium culicis]|uniref:Serine/threonine-protein kinase Sgk1 n=1 Tax=Smittium culicis TaxID=133412 RepID=A0A1R1YLV4_9FUNG|nr:Serine/threonine-protein kinase Sgk1 [Smittium culicis]
MKLYINHKDIDNFQTKDKTVLTPLTISIKNIFSKGLRYSQSIPNINSHLKDKDMTSTDPKVLSSSNLKNDKNSLAEPRYPSYNSDSLPTRKQPFKLSKYVSFSSKPGSPQTSPLSNKPISAKSIFVPNHSAPSLPSAVSDKSFDRNSDAPPTISAHITKADSYSYLSKKNSNPKIKTYKVLIKEAHPRKKIPSFPQKNGILGYSFPTDFVFTKRDKLNSILQFFLSDPNISTSSLIKNFLADDVISPSTEKYSDSTIASNIPDSNNSPNQRAIKSLYKLSKNSRKSSPEKKSSKRSSLHSDTFSIKSRKKSVSSNAPTFLPPSQLKRPRASVSRAMRKRFGFRKGVQVVGLSPITKKPNLSKSDNDRSKLNSNSSENNYFTETSDIESTLPANGSSYSSEKSYTLPNHNEVEQIELDVELMSRRKHKVSLDDFHLLTLIGKGAYGKVMLARHKDTAKVFAIKVISKNKILSRPGDVSRIMAERQVLKQVVNHPFLVGLEYAFQSSTKLYFCLDYINGGELFYHLQNDICFSENRTRFYVAEISSAIGYLHDFDIIYRDLKPENCLLDQYGHLRIVDFGLVKILGGNDIKRNRTYTFCGTPEYMAPEVLLRNPYGKEVDWYCLGAISYEMIYGLPPYYSTNPTVMYNNIVNDPLEFPLFTKKRQIVGNLTKEFISGLMIKNPSKRLGTGPNGTQLVKNHSYFNGINWDKVYKKEYLPPFIPKTSSIFELSNISPEFRNEPIPESILNEGKVPLVLCNNSQNTVPSNNSLTSFPQFLSESTQLNSENSKNQHLKHGQLINTVEEATDAFRGFSFDSVRG